MADQPQTLQYYQSGGVDTYSNPLLSDGQLIHSVNMVSFPYGAKTKRTGYSAFLGTADNNYVWSLFDFQNIGNNSGSMNLYRASGTSVWYSQQGTGAWTAMGNGTFQQVNTIGHFGHTVLGTTLIGGDGIGSTRHTTNGTSFTNTTLAPVGEFFEEYQRRIYIYGTANTVFYSTTNDATNWNTSGTSDSNSFNIPGAGKGNGIFKCADKLNICKTSGQMYKWDGYSLIDNATRYGPSSPYSIDGIEGYKFFVSTLGHYGYGGAMPQLLSNSVQRQFYNNSGSAVSADTFPIVPAVTHRYDYFATLGAYTDDFVGRTYTNGILKYDYQKNEYLNWDTAHTPFSWLSYKDTSGAQQLIFGDSAGQCYQFDNSTTDAGTAIYSEMVFVFHAGRPDLEKKWNWWRGIFNPGCEAKVQVACSNVYTYKNLVWMELGDTSSGAVEFRFPAGSRSHFLFVRIYEASKNARYSFYGQSINCEIQRVIP